MSLFTLPPSGSSAIRGGRNVYCEKVDAWVSEVILNRLLRVFSSLSYLYPAAQPLTHFFYILLSPCPLCLFHLFFRYLQMFLMPLIHSHLQHKPFFSSFFLFFYTDILADLPRLAELCPVPCGSHGVCSEGQCQCEEGWIGAACDQRACHPRCEEHGQCHDGTCICQPGWEGEHCNIGEQWRQHVDTWECLIIPSDVLISMIKRIRKRKKSVCWRDTFFIHLQPLFLVQSWRFLFPFSPQLLMTWTWL